jgi:heme/copper-type cytochrome/quinol oxidase subunit 1
MKPETVASPVLPAPELHSPESERSGWIRRYIFSFDHKTIGIQFLFAGLAYFVLGGMLAMLMRWQLAWPGDPAHPVPILGKLLGWQNGTMPADVYNIVLTIHATIMVFFVLIPLQVGAFGNYLIPLKIGARDMAFPFLNGLAFWMFIPAGTVLLAGVCLPGGGAATGWTAYPPVSAILFNGGGGDSAPRTFSVLSLLQVEHWNNPAEPPADVRVGRVSAADLFRLPPGNAPADQIDSSTWPTLPIVVNFVSFFMMFAYICTAVSTRDGSSEYVRTGVAVVVAVIAAIIAVRAVQIVAFDGQACWFVSILIVGCSSVTGAINYLTTIVKMRCPGMTMFRLPITIWNLFITSLMILFATPVLACVLVMNLMDHHRLTSFFEPANWVLSNQIQTNSGGGYVLLDPHLFWFYSHPAVYIMILPVMGIVSDILPVFSRKPLFGYRPMIYASSAIALLGFLVWGHHMFQSGMNPAMGEAFALSTIVIALPSGIKVFNWLATIWGGRLHLTVPMLNALAFVSLFVIGGLSGIVMSSTAIDAQLHMTYYIVAHIHYVLFGGSTFGIFAAIYFWYPKMFGRMMNENLGRIHFVLSYIFFNCTFFAMHILGLQGMPRRVADYTDYTLWAHLKPMNQFITISAFCLMLSQIPFVINFLGSWIWGPKAPNNPWNATTLEWTDAASPPGHGNFETIPVVYHGPYEYSSPVVAEDWLAQSRKV